MECRPGYKLTFATCLGIVLSVGKKLFIPALVVTVVMVMHPIVVQTGYTWGINHSAFLPKIAAITLSILLVVSLVVLLRPGDRQNSQAANWRLLSALFADRMWPAVAIATLAIVVFWLLRSPVHFLGDGNTNIAVYGQGEGSLYKWTSYGSMFIVRTVQRWLGSLDETTARQAFQIVSVMSGGVTVFLLMRLASRIGRDTTIRLVSAAVLLASGALLMFFGYAEFYPLLWMFGTLFLLMAIRYTQTGRGLVWVWMSFVVSVVMHAQAVVLLPALVWLTFAPRDKASRELLLTRAHLIAGLVVACIGATAFVWMYQRNLAFEVMFLPPLTGRPQSPEYAMVSLKHLIDIVNLVVVLCPSVLILVALWMRDRNRSARDGASIFLALSSAGSLAFVLMVDPVFGMGRDWDLFAFMLLPPIAWLVRRIAVSSTVLSFRHVVMIVVISAVASGSFVAANITHDAAAERFKSLLEFYDRKDRAGWSILVDHYNRIGDRQGAAYGLRQMRARFPEYDDLERVYTLVNAGRYREALPQAQRLAEYNPYNADFLQILGNIAGKLGDLGSAERLYLDAVALKPYNVGIRNELGQLYVTYGRLDEGLAVLKALRDFNPQLTFVAEGVALAYIRKGEYESALSLADSLLDITPHAPGAYLIQTTVALNRGDTSSARYSFRQFLTYGTGRSDYSAMKRHYAFLE